MKKRILIISILSVVIFNSAVAQKGITKEAQKQYDAFSYVESTKTLLNLAKKGNESIELYQSLANAYYFNNDMVNASIWYGKLLALNNKEAIDTESYYRYILSLKGIKQYDEADKWMLIFSKLKPTDSRVKRFNLQPNYLEEIEQISANFDLKNLSINSEQSDFGTAIHDSILIYASSKGNGKHYNWNNKPFLDLYQMNPDESSFKLSEDINSKYHESSAAITKDGKTMYFTRNNYYKRKLKRSNEKIYGLKLYKASLVDGEWRNIMPLPFNSDDYNTAHPALNAEGTKLYFSSNMPGTIGGSDIFVVNIDEEENYGKPQNLGSKINTEGRENFPFVSETGTLYFSSDGHVGLGGLDVFSFKNIDKVISSQEAIVNLGKPINSSSDDFAYFIKDNTLNGFVSSNRDGGRGDDDIYSFAKPACKQLISGIVIDNVTKNIIVSAEIAVLDNSKNIIKTIVPNSKGEFNFELECTFKKYALVASKTGYINANQLLVFDSKNNDAKRIEFYLTPEAKESIKPIGLYEVLELNPILFDYNSDVIKPESKIELNKIIKYLKKFPNFKIDVRSHADSRGNDEFNLKLSKRRNRATINYIIKVGDISKSRVTGQGYGETQLINKCLNNVKCSEKDHKKNRRSEFIVITK